jgi:hypothetical protein
LDPGTLSTVLSVAALGTLVFLTRPLTPQRALRRLPLSRIADAPPEQAVRIEGVIEHDGEPLAAPLSGERCVYYDADVETSSPVRARAARGLVVCVRDDSGVLLVDLGAARVVVLRHVDIGGGAGGELLRDLPPSVEEYLHDRGFADAGRVVVARERMLVVGDRVTCAGRVRRDIADGAGGADAPYRGGGTSRFRLQPAAKHPVIVALVEK